MEDHPRSCGKDRMLETMRRNTTGSPPLVRERRNLRKPKVEKQGITPARAGKTQKRQEKEVNDADHPRSCGKDRYSVSVRFACIGSPPLVRERQ